MVDVINPLLYCIYIQSSALLRSVATATALTLCWEDISNWTLHTRLTLHFRPVGRGWQERPDLASPFTGNKAKNILGASLPYITQCQLWLEIVHLSYMKYWGYFGLLLA